MMSECVPLPTGWSPGRNEGESELEATERLLREYPGTTAIRKFFSSTNISANHGALAAKLPPGVRIAVSVLGTVVPTNVADVVRQLIDRGLCVDYIQEHEPEKKTTPEMLAGAYRMLDDIFPRDDEPRRSGDLRLVVAMTVQRARVFAPDDLRRFVTSELAKLIDVLGWDWYPSYDVKNRIDRYEDPADAFRLMLDFGDEVGVGRFGFYEMHHGRVMQPEFAVDLDPGGDMCAAWMWDAYRYAADTGRCAYWAHFHTSGGRLTVPGHARGPEYNALLGMIAASTGTGDVPDPKHPQYKIGFAAGYDEGVSDGRDAGLLAGRRDMADKVTAYVAQQRP